MANFDSANKNIDSLSTDLIGVIANKDEDGFQNMCLKCESIFKDILEMHPEAMDQDEKRNAINVLRRLKDVCLQLINIKINVFGYVKEEEKKEPSSKEIASSLEQKVLSLNNKNKRAA